jgi:hypothetical protein
VFGFIAVPLGQRVLLIMSADNRDFPIPLVHAGTLGGVGDIYLPSPSTTRLYLPAGNVELRMLSLDATEATANVSVVGHLVPALAP